MASSYVNSRHMKSTLFFIHYFFPPVKEGVADVGVVDIDASSDDLQWLLLTEVNIITTSLVTSCRSTSNLAKCSNRWLVIVLLEQLCYGDYGKHLSVRLHSKAFLSFYLHMWQS